MGETQLYSQRLHGITEKRRILTEVDKIQTELEQQRVKLHQLKRKSLRDRWLMDGLVPASGVEMENPLSETEGHIKNLELQLESLQSELLYLENPELKALKGIKVQLQKELVNGERNLQQVDQNENLKEKPITEEANQPGDHQEESALSQKDLPSSTGETDRHPVLAPRGKPVSENREVEHNLDLELANSNEPDDKQTYPSQNVNGSVQKDTDNGHKSLTEENESHSHPTPKSEHSQELKDHKGEHQDQGGNPQELSLHGDNVEEVQSIPNQKLGSLENSLEQEDQNLMSSTSNLGGVSQKIDDSEPTSAEEGLNSHEFKENQNGKESLLDEITKLVNLGEQKDGNQPNEDGNKPYLSTDQLNPEPPLMPNNEENSQTIEENKILVLTNHEQGHTPDEELALTLETERAQLDLLNIQEEPEKPVAVLMEIKAPDGLYEGSVLHCEDHTPDSAVLPLETAHSSVLPLSNQETHTTLPCTDQDPSQLALSGGQNQVDQVQISQILVVTASGHEQRSSNSPQGPSASLQTGTKETSPAPESQPLLQKPQETDTHHGANTAETRDKSTPTKKKSCQCCVVM